MKKKAIEKIPYIGLKKTSRKKDVKYVGVAETKIIGGAEHLLIEVYKNEKNEKDIPEVRIALNKNDFGTYFPKTGEWNRKKIMPNGGYCRTIWEKTGEGNDWREQEKINILQNEEDLGKIRDFCKKKIYSEKHWWEYIHKYQDDITVRERRKTADRKYQRRAEALQDRINHTKELPEQRILDWANKTCFGKLHYLYYKKHGSWVQIACSKCGGVTDARWKSGISYESQFQRIVKEPKEGKYGKCPMCGTLGEYKCQGKVKGTYRKQAYYFLGQRYKENGIVLRYIEVQKRWELELTAGEKGTEMQGACEELSGIEIARAYLKPGEKVQIDYQKHSWYEGKDYWDDCNLAGLSNIAIGEGKILPETYREMQDTAFRYSGLEEYADKGGKVNPIDYLERYQQIPQLEILSKMGLTEIVRRITRGECGVIEDQNAKRLDDFLGIQRERTDQLIRTGGNGKLLDAMKTEKRLDQHWTEKQVEQMAETGLRTDSAGIALRYMTVQKMLNRIAKYAGCEYGTKCSTAINEIRRTAITYTDYLRMREERGYDLHNSVYQQPRELQTAHDQMVAEINQEKVEKRLKEVKEKYPEIREQYRKLRKEFFYEDDTYLIRPARSAEEIVTEGRILHHCVGGNNYLTKHNEGTSYILMLRFQEEPETPYITVEISAAGKNILQWYGAYDKKPDENHMREWLKEYLRKLKDGTLAETEKITIKTA
nr:MAG: PcfJ-like protein [Bacteriophage sp.]DAM38901.1 MAG TPA: PcfJ like protein [Caudoviricetes sp.]